MSVGSTLAGLAALLVLQPGSAAPRVTHAPATPAASDPAVSPASSFDAALDLLRTRDYPAAAAAFEALIASTGRARYHLQAGEAREAAGHLAHALAHWRALLSGATDLSARQRADLQHRLAALRKKVGELRLRVGVDEGDTPPIAVSLRRADERPPIELTITGETSLALDPGDWLVRAEAPGFVALERTLVIVAPPARSKAPAPPQEESLTLVRDRREIEVELGPEAAVAAGITLTLRADADVQELPERREQVVEGAAALHKLALAPGRWFVTIVAPGFRPREAVWDTDAAAPAAIALEPLPPPAPPPKPPATRPPPDLRLGLGLGLGLTGGLALGTGVGTVLRYRRVVPDFVPAPNNAGYVAALQATEVGAGLVGGGLGLGAVALTAGLGARDRALWSELAVGGALAIAGSAWYATEWQHVQKMLYDGGKAGGEVDIVVVRREIAAASVIGAGVGLALGSGVALLTRALVGRRARAPRVGVDGSGLFARF